MAVDDHVVQKNLENRIQNSLFPETKDRDVGKLISFGNLLDREITCLVFSLRYLVISHLRQTTNGEKTQPSKIHCHSPVSQYKVNQHI